MTIHKLIILLLLFLSGSIDAQSTASKQVSTFIIDAPQLNNQKTVWIYLPKDYKNSTKSYPVIYMHDAQNLFDEKTSFVGEWKIDEYLDTLPDKEEAIIVGIEHGGEKRINELTPYMNDKYGGGKGDDYLGFIVKTLKPYIDSNFRTQTGKEYTIIWGSSLGGLISCYAVIKFPETFGKGGIFSPAFWINPEFYDLVKHSEISKDAKFFFLAGTNESESMVPDLEKMVLLLLEKGIPKSNIVNRIVKGGEHNEGMWSSYVPEAYQWLVKD